MITVSRPNVCCVGAGVVVDVGVGLSQNKKVNLIPDFSWQFNNSMLKFNLS